MSELNTISDEKTTTYELILVKIVIIVFLSLYAVLTVLLMQSLSARSPIEMNSYILVLVMIVMTIAAIAFCCLSKSTFVEIVSDHVMRREAVLKLIMTLCFGSLLACAINMAAISFSQEQTRLSSLSSYPDMALKSTEPNASKRFEVFNTIGSASYMSLVVSDRCYFRHDDTPYEITINQSTKILSGTGSLDHTGKSTMFVPENQYTSEQEAKKSVTKAVYSKYPEAMYLSFNRCIEVSFFDYQNQFKTYHYSEESGTMRLVSTASHPVYSNNCGNYVMEWSSYDETVLKTLDALEESFKSYDEIYYVE